MYEFNGRQYVSATTYIKLDEEIKKLKEDLSLVIKERDDNIKMVKKLKSDVSVYKSQMNAYKEKYLALLKANTELVEENRKLKEELGVWLNANKILRMHDAKMEYDNKKLNEYNRRLKQANEDLRKQNRYWNKIVDIIPQDEKSVAEETIKDLQERIKELNEELDYVRSIKDSAESTIKTQDEKIRFLEQCLDNKEKVNKSLREENKRLSDFLECEA